MLTQRKRFESYCEVERNKDNTGKGVATVYIRSIIERKGDERLKVIIHLHKYQFLSIIQLITSLPDIWMDDLETNLRNSNKILLITSTQRENPSQPYSFFWVYRLNFFVENTLYELINGKEDRNDREFSREATTLLIG